MMPTIGSLWIDRQGRKLLVHDIIERPHDCPLVFSMVINPKRGKWHVSYVDLDRWGYAPLSLRRLEIDLMPKQ